MAKELPTQADVVIVGGGVIGTAFDSWMLDPDWQRGLPAGQQQSGATLRTVVEGALRFADNLVGLVTLAGDEHRILGPGVRNRQTNCALPVHFDIETRD